MATSFVGLPKTVIYAGHELLTDDSVYYTYCLRQADVEVEPTLTIIMSFLRFTCTQKVCLHKKLVVLTLLLHLNPINCMFALQYLMLFTFMQQFRSCIKSHFTVHI